MIPYGAFTTNDFQLAAALATLGVPLVNHDGNPAQKGECPEWREISSADLQKAKLCFEDAEKKGIGQIVYGFANHDHRKEIIDSFRAVMHSTESTEIPDAIELKCEHCGHQEHVDVYKLIAAGMAAFHRTASYLYPRRKLVQSLYRFRKEDGNDFIFNPRTTPPEILKLHGVE